MARLGRPSKYTPKLAALICRRLADGESLTHICRDDDMPHRGTVVRWMQGNEPFRANYAQARDIGLDVMADQLLERAGSDAGEYIDEFGNCRVDSGRVNRDRLYCDALKWYLSKLAPKRYGDKLDVKTEHSGAISIRWQRDDEDKEAQA
jgi:hypothetical protein